MITNLVALVGMTSRNELDTAVTCEALRQLHNDVYRSCESGVGNGDRGRSRNGFRAVVSGAVGT